MAAYWSNHPFLYIVLAIASRFWWGQIYRRLPTDRPFSNLNVPFTLFFCYGVLGVGVGAPLSTRSDGVQYTIFNAFFWSGVVALLLAFGYVVVRTLFTAPQSG